jgi:hypothetical protein
MLTRQTRLTWSWKISNKGEELSSMPTTMMNSTLPLNCSKLVLTKMKKVIGKGSLSKTLTMNLEVPRVDSID